MAGRELRGAGLARWRAVGAVLLAAVVAGCDGGGGQAAPSPVPTVVTSVSPVPTPVVSVSATPVEPEPTITPAPTGDEAGAALVAAPDGLGQVRMGDGPDAVIEAISARLGAPDEDSDWQPIGSLLGVCPGTLTRVVRWGQVSAHFSDGPSTYAGAGQRHLFGYTISDPDDAPADALGEGPLTAEGIGVGSTVAELQAAYGEDVLDISPGDELGGPYWDVAVDPEPGRDSDGLRGQLTGEGPEDVVASISAGEQCGE